MTGYSSDDGAIKLYTCVLEAVTSLESPDILACMYIQMLLFLAGPFL
jgi:hypothetical protein